jgi:oligogalacturonide lyase
MDMSAKPRSGVDPESGLQVTQLTSGPRSHRHLYFTHPGWINNGRDMVVISDDADSSDLHVVSLHSGESRQVTRLSEHRRQRIWGVAVNHWALEAYLFLAEELIAISLTNGTEEVICGPMDGFQSTPPSLSADGRYIYTAYHEAIFRTQIGGAKLPLETRWRMRPLSRVVRIDRTTGEREIVHEQRCYIKHVNASPVQPHLLTFCHEGPWLKVDARIWCLDTQAQRVWCVRPRRAPDERVGHEYWLSDGMRLGYHGHYHYGTPRVQPFFGFIRCDGAECEEVPVPRWADGYHYHSLDARVAVSDGTAKNPRLLLWQKGDRWSGPFVVARHDSSVKSDFAHVHPCFSKLGSSITYTSDCGGNAQVYRVRLPDKLTGLQHLAIASCEKSACAPGTDNRGGVGDPTCGSIVPDGCLSPAEQRILS